MSHSPGYGKLLSWTPVPVMPTPAAVGDIVKSYATSTKQQVLCADIGGATTDVFSVFFSEEGKALFNRTVSANLGMSYSVANVLVETGVSNIARWLPFELSEYEIRDRLRNKMIRPTSIPQIEEDLLLEQAVCREALRLSLVHHRELAVGLSGQQQQRGIADIFSQSGTRDLVDMMGLDVVIGSGGVLSHAPQRLQTAMMMIDGFGLEGVTQLAVDSIFMMPHLGVFASVHPEAANEVFLHDCLVNIAHSVVPVCKGTPRVGKPLAKITFDGKTVGDVMQGEVTHFEAFSDVSGELEITPLTSNITVGSGWGKPFKKLVTLGQHGIIADGRNRPYQASADDAEQRAQQKKISTLWGSSFEEAA